MRGIRWREGLQTRTLYLVAPAADALLRRRLEAGSTTYGETDEPTFVPLLLLLLLFLLLREVVLGDATRCEASPYKSSTVYTSDSRSASCPHCCCFLLLLVLFLLLLLCVQLNSSPEGDEKRIQRDFALVSLANCSRRSPNRKRLANRVTCGRFPMLLQLQLFTRVF